MYCIKCGKETKDDQVFCEACLVLMEKYPVRPGIPVMIPPRAPDAPKKPSARRRIISQEEQLSRLRSGLKGLSLALLCCLLALGLTISLLVHTAELYQEAQDIGKNYNTVDMNT